MEWSEGGKERSPFGAKLTQTSFYSFKQFRWPNDKRGFIPHTFTMQRSSKLSRVWELWWLGSEAGAMPLRLLMLDGDHKQLSEVLSFQYTTDDGERLVDCRFVVPPVVADDACNAPFQSCARQRQLCATPSQA